MAQDSALARLPSQSLADQARQAIRRAIFEGKLKPEERLTIDRIAKELGISRTPVREALKALEADGLVQIFPRRGAIVQRLTREDIEDLYRIRARLEGLAGELACRCASGDFIEKLDVNQRQMAAAIDRGYGQHLDAAKDLLRLNDAFHDVIVEASGSVRLPRLLRLSVMPLGYRLYYWTSPERRKCSLDFHQQIIAAFRSKDPDLVRKLVEQHILEARDFLLSMV